ncbi:hypothetical protein QUF72_21810 [Desulfobacterales bacterium HSG2]|nr:hypothetical protein [Desulfobacterales bacterium HSG2]
MQNYLSVTKMEHAELSNAEAAETRRERKRPVSSAKLCDLRVLCV